MATVENNARPAFLNPVQVWQAAMDVAVTPDGQPTHGWKVEGKTEVNRLNIREKRYPLREPMVSEYTLSKDVQFGGKTATLVLEREYKLFRTIDNWDSITGYRLSLNDPTSGEILIFAYTSFYYGQTPENFRSSCNRERDTVDQFERVVEAAIAVSSRVYIVNWCGSCFTPDMQLQRRDGSPIGLGELAALNSAGKALPQIASLNEETGEVVYQTPVQVIDHGVHSSPVLQLASGLRVTPNHPLYVSQPNGNHTWKPAGELTAGDCLASPLSSCTPYVPSSTMTLSGAHQVFDLSMPGPHNFLVKSPSSSSWTIAHNKMIP